MKDKQDLIDEAALDVILERLMHCPHPARRAQLATDLLEQMLVTRLFLPEVGADQPAADEQHP